MAKEVFVIKLGRSSKIGAHKIGFGCSANKICLWILRDCGTHNSYLNIVVKPQTIRRLIKGLQGLVGKGR